MNIFKYTLTATEDEIRQPIRESLEKTWRSGSKCKQSDSFRRSAIIIKTLNNIVINLKHTGKKFVLKVQILNIIRTTAFFTISESLESAVCISRWPNSYHLFVSGSQNGNSGSNWLLGYRVCRALKPIA